MSFAYSSPLRLLSSTVLLAAATLGACNEDEPPPPEVSVAFGLRCGSQNAPCEVGRAYEATAKIDRLFGTRPLDDWKIAARGQVRITNALTVPFGETIPLIGNGQSSGEVRFYYKCLDAGEGELQLTDGATSTRSERVACSRDIADIVVSTELNEIGSGAKIGLGTRPAGVTFESILKVANSGRIDLAMTGSVVATQTNCAANIARDAPAKIAPGAPPSVIAVSLTPTASGKFSALVSIPSSDPDENPFTVTLEGTAVAEPDIEVGRALTFPNNTTQEVGDRPAGTTFTIFFEVENRGSADLTMTEPSIPESSKTNCAAAITKTPSSPLAPGASDSLELTIQPTAEGPFSFTVNLPSNDPDENPFSFVVAGVATAADPCAHADPMRLIEGKKIYRVPVNVGCSGDAVCAAAGLTCAGVPVLGVPSAACVAFHPGTQVKSDVNGWRQSVYCDGTKGGLACNGEVQCHDCPACGTTGLQCNDPNSSLLAELYVECQ